MKYDQQQSTRPSRPCARRQDLRAEKGSSLDDRSGTGALEQVQIIATRSMTQVRSLQRGSSVLRLVVLISVALFIAGVGWFSYAEYRRQYWDDVAAELCMKEGGVEILQFVELTPAQYESMPRAGGHIGGHAPIELTPPTVPTYAESREEVIRRASPRVWKTVSRVIRKSDGATVARWVSVHRLGGDPLAIDHPSSFTCPPFEQLYTDLEKIFIRRENK